MSLRVRLLFAIGIIALVALVVADVATYRALEGFLYQRVNAQLDQIHRGYEDEANTGQGLICLAPGQTALAGPGGIGGGRVGPPSGRLPNLQFPAAEIRTTSGTVVGNEVCPAYVNGTRYSPLIQGTIGGFSKQPDGTQVAYFNAPSTQAGGPGFRVRASVLGDGNLLLVAQPLGDTASTLHRLFLIELAVTAGAIVVALLGGFWLVRFGLRPLREMERTAELIAAGNLTERVPGENENTEVGRLARTLNLMLGRIESAFAARLESEHRARTSEARMRQFVADASHELRTPIAAVSAYAELFGRGASEQKDDLERVMGGIRNETGRMEHLVADLLLLARLDEGRPMELHPVDLVALCAEAVQTASTVGPAWPLTFEAREPIEVMGDQTALRQVIDNLLGNVRAHTPAGTAATVRVERDGFNALVSVSDQGPGMSPEEAGHIFERFYRSDPSRSRQHGGAGLGLSIVSAIVHAHRGSVTAEGRPGTGATFVVRLPLVSGGAGNGSSAGAESDSGAAAASSPAPPAGGSPTG